VLKWLGGSLDPGPIFIGYLGLWMLGNAYRRQEFHIAGVETPPYLYFPSFSDPSSYKVDELESDRFSAIADDLIDDVTNSPVAEKSFFDNLAPVVLPEPATAKKVVKNGAKQQDKRGRVLVPAKHVREAGFKPGQIAYAVVDSGQVTLYRKAPDSFQAMYDVEKGWNVRVSKNVLTQADLDSKPVIFESEPAKIIISA